MSAMVKINDTETLINRCLRNLANNFQRLDIDNFSQMPKNLKAIFFRIISKRGLVTDDNICVFIDEDTKCIELNECLKITNSGLSRLTICKNMKKLDLNSNSIERPEINSEAINLLALSCQHLHTILMRRCVNIQDDCIEALTLNCRNLNTVNIGNCPLITDKALASIGKNCNKLTSINFSGTKVTDDGVFSLMTSNVAKTIEEIHMAHCDLITDESIENILMDSKTIKYLIFHCCKKTTAASRLALEEYMSNNSNQKVKHITWSIY